MLPQIYHPWNKWECYRAGFWARSSGDKRQEQIAHVVAIFSDAKETQRLMRKVLNTWTYSCEHNLSNRALNRIAWLGQSACCIEYHVPSLVTMEAWQQVEPKHQAQANHIAARLIAEYDYEREGEQLCLNFI